MLTPEEIRRGSWQPGAAPAQAAWRVYPELTVRQTYTDNAFVGSTPRRSDFVTQVTPQLLIDGRGPRLSGHLDYRPSALIHSKHSEGNDFINALDAAGRLEAVERIFFIEAGGNVHQHFISPFSPQPGDVTSESPNRVEVRTFSVSPYLRSELGRDFEYELRHRQIFTTSDNSTLGDFRTAQSSARLARAVRLFGWALEYDDTTTHREDVTVRADQESRLLRGRLFFQPNENWRLSASGGREENNFVLEQVERESIYGAGVRWRPGPRTTADFEYEHRFFGPSRLARLAHRTRATAWNIGYWRETSTFQEQVLSLPPGNTAALLDQIFMARISDPAQRANAVRQFIQTTGTPESLAGSLAFYTQRVFVRDGVDAAFAILGARNSITFTVFSADNTRISADSAAVATEVFALTDRFKQRGFGIHANHKLTANTIASLTVSRVATRQAQPADFESRNSYYNFTLHHPLSPKTAVFGGFAVTRFEPEDNEASQAASTVFVGLNHRF